MHPELQQLEEAARGLLYISESDHGFDAVELKDNNKPVEEQLKELYPSSSAVIEKIALEAFLGKMLKIYSLDPNLQSQVPQIETLKALLETKLKDVAVYRIGSIAIDAVILGQLSDGSYGGLHTKLVET